jgi:hypothetical protein
MESEIDGGGREFGVASGQEWSVISFCSSVRSGSATRTRRCARTLAVRWAMSCAPRAGWETEGGTVSVRSGWFERF